MRDFDIYRTQTSDTSAQVVWSAKTKDNQTLGTLIIRTDNSVIQWIGTHPKHRRKGIATALLARARQDGFTPLHSVYRTPEGDLWARSTGDSLPRVAHL